MGYRVSSGGVTPTREKVKAIEVWPEELANDTQVKQLFGTTKYCQMFTGPAFADMARPLAELTKKDVDFKRTPRHTNAVRTLKELLDNYVQLQLPDPAKSYVFKSDAPGYAVRAVPEREGGHWASRVRG